MSRVGKWLIGVVAALVVLVFGAWLSLWFAFRGTPSDIVNFHPTEFQAKADAAFFFSVGDELKYSNEVDPHAPTLSRGHIDNFLVSPTRDKIAVVTSGTLLIVNADGSGIRQVATVDSIYKSPKPIGRSFFRDHGFQWSRDSKHLYLIRDQYYESKGSQLYSDKGELWRYDLESGNSQLVVKPFPAYTCSWQWINFSAKLYKRLDDRSLIRRKNLNRQVIREADRANRLLLNRKLIGSNRLDFDRVQLARR